MRMLGSVDKQRVRSRHHVQVILFPDSVLKLSQLSKNFLPMTTINCSATLLKQHYCQRREVPSLYSNPNQAGIPQAFWKNTSLDFVDDIEHFR